NTSEFIIQGFSDNPELQFPIFLLFLFIYLFNVLGNLIIFFAVLLNSHLHTPMYILLLNLSVSDMAFTQAILPKFLHMVFTQRKTITFRDCMTQMYVFSVAACSEHCLLTAMAYDRYVAICDPLHYVTHMSLRRCALLITITWIAGFLTPTGHVISLSNLSYCSGHVIDHFYCDSKPLLKLSCTDTSNVDLLNYIIGTLLYLNCFLLTLISYIYIISTILKIKSTEGRHKAFSTCASHLTCVLILYGTIVFLYLRPTSSYSLHREKYFGLMLVVLIPSLNPLIYTLKNKEFQSAFQKLCQSYYSF
ncbi:hypothetical protein GDO86_018701, partial [Hymenochirus boettgeri]